MRRPPLPLLPSVALLSLLALSSLPDPVAAQAPAGGGGTGQSTTSKVCGWDYSCPKTSPCCSEYGYCAAGVNCLAGCNPQGSYGQGYCAPIPACQSTNYTFTDTSKFQMDHSAWDGDASKYDFTLDKLDSSNNSIVQNDELVLTLTEDGGGTRVSTTRSVLYGSISASIKTVGAAGVVTAFITMSGVKDEIDFEWTTNNTDQVQTNYYWEGDVDNYSHGGKHTANNRDSSYLTYTMHWTPSQLDWEVNGKTVRTLKKSDTKEGRYPQTPSRVQFSVWPAGIDGTSQGTIDWAGGMIDWSSAEYTSQGSYSAHVKWLAIDCYSGSDLALPFNSSSRLAKREDEAAWLWERQSQTVSSYMWGTNDTNGQIGVQGSDKSTVINSPYSTGQNMIVKNGDTKGVTKTSGGGASGSTGIFGDTAVGNWWARQGTAVKAGIIVGICAVALFILVAICTIWARSRDRRKRKAALSSASASAAGKDTIPLVATGGRRPGAAGGVGGADSTLDLPGRFKRQDSSYAESVPSTKGSFRAHSPYGDGRAGTPPVPTLPQQYQYQQGYGAPAYGQGQRYGQYGAQAGPGSPYGGYPQQGYGQGHGYGNNPAQAYAQQWPGYGGGGQGRY
ncbi:hypothetical protein JCM10207_001203 [Rhodosporidiobolus poonsookiae]